MSYLWKCVLPWCTCLLLFLEIVTAQFTCLQFGDCLPGFFCHTGSGLCMGCDKCSHARGNLRLCENECITYIPITYIPTSPDPEIHMERAPITSQEPTIPVIAAIVVAIVVLLAVIVVAVIVCRRRSKRRMGTGVPETGYIEPSEMPTPPPLDCAIPDESVNPPRDCAIPDESVNQQQSLLQRLLPNNITES